MQGLVQNSNPTSSSMCTLREKIRKGGLGGAWFRCLQFFFRTLGICSWQGIIVLNKKKEHRKQRL